MTNDFPPAAILILGALLVPFFKGKAKNWYVILLPAAAFYLISQLKVGSSWQVHFFGFDLTFLRVDKLSKVFGYIFTMNAVAAFVYAFYLKDNTQHMAALLYIGSSLGVVFAGDLVSLYFFWEVMAVASTFLILGRKTEKAQAAGMRYIMVHTGCLGLLCFSCQDEKGGRNSHNLPEKIERDEVTGKYNAKGAAYVDKCGHVLGAVFQIKGIDKCRNRVQGEDIPEDLAQFIHPQKSEVKAKEMDLP